MRVWANTPFIGSEVAKFSRRYFFSAAVVAYAIISAYQWAGFPYDNLCRKDEPQTGAEGTYEGVSLANGGVLEDPITVENDEFFKFCRQSWRGFDRLPFPPTARQQPDDTYWMTDSQETLTGLYGYTAVVFLASYLFFFFGAAGFDYFLSWFRGVYKSKGTVTKPSKKVVAQSFFSFRTNAAHRFQLTLGNCWLYSADQDARVPVPFSCLRHRQH